MLWKHRGKWCEIGCWKGRSTLILAESGCEGWAIDWGKGSPEHGRGVDNRKELATNLAVYSNVHLLHERFEDVADKVPDGLNLLHLDAEHSLGATVSAFELYRDKLATDGKLIVHDAFPLVGNPWPGVAEFAKTLDWPFVEAVGRTGVWRKP